MSKKGIEYAVFGLLNEATGTYSNGVYMSPVAGYNGTPTNSDVKDYGDNRVVETDKSTTGGKLSVEFNNDSEDIYIMLLGHTKNSNGEILHNANDVAPYVGTGAIGKSEGQYVVKFYKKVQFAEPNDENTTKQENTTFNHVTLEGDIFIPEDGEWKIVKRFPKLSDAKAWLNAKVGLSTTPSIALSQTSANMTVGDTLQLEVYTNQEEPTVTWASATTATATVADGLVTAAGAGSSIITASITIDGVTYTAACAVNVAAAS